MSYYSYLLSRKTIPEITDAILPIVEFSVALSSVAYISVAVFTVSISTLYRHHDIVFIGLTISLQNVQHSLTGLTGFGDQRGQNEGYGKTNVIFSSIIRNWSKAGGVIDKTIKPRPRPAVQP